jgi:apolipoprotein N-acyltransferase
MSSPAGAALMLRSAAFRAIEQRRWLVRATPTGISALVDPRGRVAARTSFGAAEVLEGAVRPATVRTVYARVGEAPLLLAAGCAVMLAIAPRREPREGPGRAGARGEGEPVRDVMGRQ